MQCRLPRKSIKASFGTEIGSLTIGTVVKMNVNSAAKEFIVVHQGKPSSLYDDSCDGTWLLMKDVYENRKWHSSNVNDYANSTIHSYLNSTFLGLLDSDIQAVIKQVKIPYVNGTGSDGSVDSRANGLAAKIFLLSGYEVGFTQSVSSKFPIDGAKLDYFVSGDDSTAQAKRIANLNEMAAIWWLRSPNTGNTNYALLVKTNGSFTNSNCSGSYGIRPALVLPSTVTVNNSMNVKA